MGNEAKSKAGGVGPEITPGDVPGNEKDDQYAESKQQVIDGEGVCLVCAKHLESETDQKRPATGLLVVGNPVREIFSIFKRTVIAESGLSGKGHILTHIGVDIFVIIDPMGAGGYEGDQSEGEKKQDDQEKPISIGKFFEEMRKIFEADQDRYNQEKAIDFQTQWHPFFQDGGNLIFGKRIDQVHIDS